MDKYSFQNCQKIVVFSKDFEKVLLCKRKGERDYDGVYSFIGGKMELTDESLVRGMQREKNEEIGNECRLLLFPLFNTMALFRKADGSSMILPHYLAVFEGGTIHLNEEYSDFQWVEITTLNAFEPKIPNVAEIVHQLLRLRQLVAESEYLRI